MLKFQLATKDDLRLAAAIERRRQIEEERKPRIFNARVRKIGVDKDFLDKQVQEKKQQRELEQTKEHQQDEALARNSKLAILLEKQQEEERRKFNKEIEVFRRLYQRPEDRRDYDLYDPEALRKALPARLGDEDPRLGPSSAQKFEGEDCNKKHRLKAQKEQSLWWIERQKQERDVAERERQDAEKAYQEAVISRDKRALELDRMEQECRRRLNEATARFNRALAEEQEERRRTEAKQDEEDNKAEIYNHVTGDFLTEAREQAESAKGPKKPLANRYKGMSADELKIFRDEQAKQMEAIQKMKAEEKRMNEEWNRLMSGHAQAAELHQCEINRKRMDLNKKIAEENLRLAQEQKSHQEYLNRVVYKNKPTAAFYEQFNKGTR